MIKKYLTKIINNTLSKRLEILNEKLDEISSQLDIYTDFCESSLEDKEDRLQQNFKKVEQMTNELKGVIAMTRATVTEKTKERKSCGTDRKNASNS